MTVFAPTPVPVNPDDISAWIEEQLRTIGEALQPQLELQLVKRNVVPALPREGMVVLADGTNWDPGSGEGFYGYYNGSWTKLG